MRREALSGAGRSPGRKLPQYNQGHGQTEQHAAMEAFRDQGERGGKKATWKAYSGIIPSCTLCMSSLVFEAFPHNKRIRHKRQIVRKQEALNQATYQELQSSKRGKCEKWL